MSKWEKVRLGDICTLKSGKSLNEEILIDHGEIPYIKVSDLSIRNNTFRITCSTRYVNRKDVENQLFPKGTTVFPKRGGAIATNKKRITSCEVCADLNIMGVIPGEKILPEYLYAYFQKIDLGMLGNGSSVPQINNGDIAPLQIPLPPLDIQILIAKAVATTAEVLAMRKQQLAELDNLIKSIFYDMFGDPFANEKGWLQKQLSSYCLINPRKAEINVLSDDLQISFVPMQSVSESGEIDTSDIREYKDVKSGFTYFYENDVLFAKITPCMENGKGAIARNLKNNIGFGSTEFHVLRPIEGISNSEWLYRLTSLPTFRRNAEKNMSGSAGQKRVPTSFFEKCIVPLPPIELQNQFADIVAKIEEQKALVKKAIDETQLLFDSLMSEYFG
ncbi:restriction endonuclease subunit S [Ferviditalea candida]|uniref:Restriction endonuclease subunit S n=1 Tax=Ferviditalea candida TaxID=3108399 RepID=A0ABU5ZR15_9BACL|nr:restriction endonuclease subunit S [Paenibacillaceae bacterium T2]